MLVDCLIIGGGPAGLTAGIYLRRFHREIRIYDAGCSRATMIPRAYNYPGFPDGISGKDLLARLRDQLKRYGGEVINETVDHLELSADHVFLAQASGKTIRAKNVLLATGIIDIEPALVGFQSLKEQGLIRFCPICDGYEFTGHNIGIIGAGEHAIREAEFIKHFTKQLSFIVLGTDAEIDESLVQRLTNNDINIIVGEGRQLSTTSNGSIQLEMIDNTIHSFDVIYCALGAHARSDLAVRLGARQDEQHCLLVDKHLQSSIPGLYVAGDVVRGLDQLAVATGHAAIASTAIHNRLLR